MSRLLAATECAEACGRAETRDGDEKSGDDPRGLQPARAIRRALANGRLKASDVGAVWACYDCYAFSNAQARARSAIELALGSHADAVDIDLRPALRSPSSSIALAEARCAGAVAQGLTRVGLAVSIGVAGMNSAVAFRAMSTSDTR